MTPKLPILRTLLISDGRNSSTAIFRLIFEGLHNQGAISFQCIFENETTYHARFESIQRADVVFFFQTSSPASLSLLRLAKRLGKSTIFSFDADFQGLNENTFSEEIGTTLNLVKFHKAMVREADLVWLFTAEMIQRYHQMASRITLGIFPSPLELLPVDECFVSNDEGKQTIVYIGSSFHQKDFQIAVSPLLKLIKSGGSSLTLEFIGYAPDELRGHPRVKSRPFFDDLLEYYTYMKKPKWALGLFLLEDTLLNRSKTNKMYRDYASFGIPAIYSDMKVSSSCVTHLINGYLTPHTSDGVGKALQTMLTDRVLRQNIRRSSLQDVSCNYSLKAAQLQLLEEISLLSINKIRYLVKKPKLLVIGYEKVSSTHIDALQPCREMQQAGRMEFIWKEPGQATKNDIETTQAIYLVRAFEKVNMDVLRWAKKNQKPLICSWDDNFFLLPQDTPLGQLYTQPKILKVMRTFLRECSQIMASTPPLASFSRRFNNQVMESMYGLRAPIILNGVCKNQECPSDKIRIGFFGVNFGIDSPFIFKSLKNIRDLYQDKIIIEMIGHRPSDEILKLLDAFFDIIWDYDTALSFLKSRSWNIGLAPLANTPFNEARQATKFRDYAWCGAAIIASEVPTYQRTFLNGIHGLLVKNESPAWTEAIAELIEDSGKRDFLANGAKQLLLNLHMQEKTIASWYQLVWRIMKFEHIKSIHSANNITGSEIGKREKIIRVPLKKHLSFDLMVHQPNWEGIDVFVDSNKKPPRGYIELLVFSTPGDQVRKSILDLSQSEEDSWLEFRFPPLANSEFKLFKLKFSIFNYSSKLPVYFYEIKTESPELKSLFNKLRAGGRGKLLFCNEFYA